MKHLSHLLAIAFLCIGQIAYSQIAGWGLRVPITVTENSGAPVTDYQLKVTYDTQLAVAFGIIQPDGRDIRFASDCGPNPTFYNYWIESGLGTANTVIWVKIDSLNANEVKNIFLYVQNPAATAMSSIPNTFLGPHSATDSVSGANTGGVTDSQRGFRFAPTEDILMTHFGKNEPTGSTRYETLFNFSTQAILAQTQVSGLPNQYSYGALSSPIWLTQGTQYLAIIHQGSSDGYYFGASPQMGQHLTYFDMRYCNGCDQNTFPTNSLGGMHYGYVDFWYYTKNNLAVPPTFTVGEPDQLSTPNLQILGDNNVCLGESTFLTSDASGNLQWSNSATTDTIFITADIPTTTYTLYAYASNGCLDTANIIVTGNPYPAVDASASVAQICVGDSVTLSSSAAISYTPVWDNGAVEDGTYAPTSTTTYHVLATSTAGCSDEDSVTVTVNQLPTVSANASSTSICIGDEVTLNGGGADTYVWNSVVNNVPFAPAVTATYTVTGTDANGCEASASVTVTVGCFGINENLNAGITIYPNPATEKIMFSGLDYNINIDIVDMAGRKIKSVKNISNSLEIADLAKGSYTLLIYRTGSNELIQKTNLIKQ